MLSMVVKISGLPTSESDANLVALRTKLTNGMTWFEKFGLEPERIWISFPTSRAQQDQPITVEVIRMFDKLRRGDWTALQADITRVVHTAYPTQAVACYVTQNCCLVFSAGGPATEALAGNSKNR